MSNNLVFAKVLVIDPICSNITLYAHGADRLR